MKSVLIAVTLALSLAACGGGYPEPLPPETAAPVLAVTQPPVLTLEPKGVPVKPAVEHPVPMQTSDEAAR